METLQEASADFSQTFRSLVQNEFIQKGLTVLSGSVHKFQQCRDPEEITLYSNGAKRQFWTTDLLANPTYKYIHRATWRSDLSLFLKVQYSVAF